MTKRKSIFIILSSIILALLLGIGVFIGANYYTYLSKTGLKNTIPYGFGKEAKVIILAGQSNAVGHSSIEYLKKNVTPEQYAKYEKQYDNVYINDYATTMQQAGGFILYQLAPLTPYGIFGPDLSLTDKLNELYPDETFFIIKCAWGGTDLCKLWRSPSSGGETGQLYTGFVDFVKRSLQFLTLKNYDVSVEAMCWMQGESDSVDEEYALAYESNLSNFITDVRAEFSEYASQDGIAFVDAYIADSIFWTHYQTINKAKLAVANSSPMNTVIDTISHGLTVTQEPIEQPDLAHYDSLSEIKLGHLFADECIKFFD